GSQAELDEELANDRVAKLHGTLEAKPVPNAPAGGLVLEQRANLTGDPPRPSICQSNAKSEQRALPRGLVGVAGLLGQKIGSGERPQAAAEGNQPVQAQKHHVGKIDLPVAQALFCGEEI